MVSTDVKPVPTESSGPGFDSPQLQSRISMEDNMEEGTPKTRVRMNFAISTKGIFTPNITAEAEDVETATRLLNDATAEMNKFAEANKFSREYK